MTVFHRPAALAITLVFLLIGAAFLTQVVPYRQIMESQRRVESAGDLLASLEAENRLLQADVDALNTDEEIEKLAREKLGYIREGETAYVVLDPPAEDSPPSPVAESAPTAPQKTWVDRLWEYVTGGDMAE